MATDQKGLLEKLQSIAERFDELGRQIAEPEAMADMKRFVALNKEYKELTPIVEVQRKYADLLSNITNARTLLEHESDEELRAMAKEELELMEGQVEPMEEEIRLLLLPQDPQDAKNAIVEIRAGTGGDEASIFALGRGCMGS